MINTGQVLNGREWLANGTALLIRLYSLHFTIFLSLLFFASVVFGETTQIKSDQHLISGDSPKQDALSQMREADALPAQVLIPGVPFISWQEAARIKYPDKNIVNPSIVASFGMVFKFLGKDEKLIESRDFAKSSGLQVVSDKSSGKSWTIRDLKASLAQRHPVVVALPLTPMAHPLYFTFELFIKLGQIKGVALNDKGRPRSNALGRMMSLEDLKKIADQIEMNPIRESVLIAGRVVIGYNDDKKVFIVHDPTFGPAFEFSYDDFDKMWEAADRNYNVIFPESLPQGMTGNNVVTAYRERTPDEHAAVHFIYGYALDCLGRLSEGANHFEKGLSIADISKGYQFLLHFELALNLGERGDFAQAIEEAEEAKAIVPEAPSPWDFLSKVYLIGPDGGNPKKARDNEKTAQALMKDQRALKTFAAAIPADFMIQYLLPVRGWGGE